MSSTHVSPNNEYTTFFERSRPTAHTWSASTRHAFYTYLPDEYAHTMFISYRYAHSGALASLTNAKRWKIAGRNSLPITTNMGKHSALCAIRLETLESLVSGPHSLNWAIGTCVTAFGLLVRNEDVDHGGGKDTQIYIIFIGIWCICVRV